MKQIKQFIQSIADYVKENVHNPGSTLTNLTFVLVGYLRLDVNFWIGAFVIFVGIASTGFHWTRRDAWHKLDIVAIYYLFAVLSGWLWLGDWGILPGLVVGGAAHWSFTNYSRYSWQVIGTLGTLCLIPYWIQWGWQPTLFMMMWFMMAFGVAQLATWLDPDESGKWYDAWHGIWHIFAGIGIYYLILPPLRYITTQIMFV